MPVKSLKNLQSKVTDETYDLYEQTLENSECTSRGQFVELLLESYLNPKTKPVEVEKATSKQIEEIQLKENEIARLKTDLDFKKQEIEALGEECRIYNKQLNDAKKKLEELITTPEPLSKEQVLVTLSPVMSVVLDIEAELASKRKKQEVSRAQILENCFFETIDKGRYDPHRYWDRSELRDLTKQIIEAQP